MVEHAWVRIAELREDAAWEEWELANPKLAALRKKMRLQRIRLLNRWIEFRQSERGQRLDQQLRAYSAAANLWYLAATRCFFRPSRARAAQLSNKQLMVELDARGIDRDDCVERRDLLDALCGESSEELLEHEDGQDACSSEVDKMV